MTTPTPQQRTVRRADRYKKDSGVSPSTELMQRTAAPAPPPVLQPTPIRPTPAPQLERTGLDNSPSSQRRIPAGQPLPSAAYPPDYPAASPQRMPRWLFLSLIGCVLVMMSLIASSALMNAYLTTRQRERDAAYQRVLDNHPMQFQDLIDRYAAENNLNPAFVAAIIMNESSFRTGATSSVGARGLMQLMPDTAEWIAGKLDDHSYHFDDMYTAEKNIRYGTWYLSYLSRLFRGDAILVSAAYHAGQGEVTSWLSDPSMSSDGLTISLEDMINGNTKTYVGRVTQDYAIYEAIYYPDASAQPAAGGDASSAGR